MAILSNRYIRAWLDTSIVQLLLWLRMLSLVTGSLRWATPPDLIDKTGCAYDYIVVGSGPGGSRVTEKLLRQGKSTDEAFTGWAANSLGGWSYTKPVSVLLIEAGDEPAPFSDIPLFNLWSGDERWNWRYPIEINKGSSHIASEGQRLTVLAGKVLGGGSSINGMGYQRGNRRDYETWSSEFKLGEEWSWPAVIEAFKKDEANNDFDLSNDTHGRSGPLAVTSVRVPDQRGVNALRLASADEGIKWADHQDGDDVDRAYFLQVNEYRGRRVSANTAFLAKHLGGPGRLHVMLNSQVSRVLIRSSTKPQRAIGVEIINTRNKSQMGDTRQCFARREVVLSAGAIGTPKLLLLSGIGDAKHLEALDIPVVHENPLVGQNLQNHVGLQGIYLKGAYNSLVPAKQDWNQLEQYLKSGNGTYATNNVAAFASVYFRSRPDTNLYFADVEATFSGTRGFGLGLGVHPKYNEYFERVAAQGNIHSVTIYLQKPRSRGHVRLRSSNPLDDPVVNFNYLADESDVYTLVAGARRFLRVLNSTHFKAINMTLNEIPFPPCASEAVYSSAYLQCLLRQATHSNFHFAGTAMMHGLADKGVVDSRCRVYGIRSLRVADASIAPLIPNGHMMAPSYLIGSRCGDFAVDDYKQGLIPEYWPSPTA